MFSLPVPCFIGTVSQFFEDMGQFYSLSLHVIRHHNLNLVALAAVPSKAVVLLLFVHCCSHCLCFFCVRSLFCYTIICVLSSFAIILL